MLCEQGGSDESPRTAQVLILVLMEDALRGTQFWRVARYCYGVLILVLMEDALREYSKLERRAYIQAVLILVLMEDALRGWTSGSPATR